LLTAAGECRGGARALVRGRYHPPAWRQGFVRNLDRIWKLARPEIRVDVPHLRCRLRERRGRPANGREQGDRQIQLLPDNADRFEQIGIVRQHGRKVDAPMHASRTQVHPEINVGAFLLDLPHMGDIGRRPAGSATAA